MMSETKTKQPDAPAPKKKPAAVSKKTAETTSNENDQGKKVKRSSSQNASSASSDKDQRKRVKRASSQNASPAAGNNTDQCKKVKRSSSHNASPATPRRGSREGARPKVSPLLTPPQKPKQSKEHGPRRKDMKAFVIPRKAKEKELLEEISLDSNSFQKYLLPAIVQQYRDPASRASFQYGKAFLVHNSKLEKEFQERRKELKEEGRTDKELAEQYAFLLVENMDIAKLICNDGLHVRWTGEAKERQLGHGDMGVYMNRYSDILSPGVLDTKKEHILLVLKVLKGKVKVVPLTTHSQAMEPTPKFESHVAKNVTVDFAASGNRIMTFVSNQIYCYQFGELDMVTRPQQVCPFALVHFKYTERQKESPATGGTIIELASKKDGDRDDSSIVVKKPPLLSSSYTTPITLWKGKLMNGGKEHCNASIVSSRLPYLPADLPRRLDLGSALSISKIKQIMPSDISKHPKLCHLPRFHEVSAKGRYFTYAQLRKSGDMTAFAELHKCLKDNQMALQKKVGNKLIFVLPPCALTDELGIAKSAKSHVLHALFVSNKSTFKGLTDVALNKSFSGPNDSRPPLPVINYSKETNMKTELEKLFQRENNFYLAMNEKPKPNTPARVSSTPRGSRNSAQETVSEKAKSEKKLPKGKVLKDSTNSLAKKDLAVVKPNHVAETASVSNAANVVESNAPAVISGRLDHVEGSFSPIEDDSPTPPSDPNDPSKADGEPAPGVAEGKAVVVDGLVKAGEAPDRPHFSHPPKPTRVFAPTVAAALPELNQKISQLKELVMVKEKLATLTSPSSNATPSNTTVHDCQSKITQLKTNLDKLLKERAGLKQTEQLQETFRLQRTAERLQAMTPKQPIPQPSETTPNMTTPEPSTMGPAVPPNGGHLGEMDTDQLSNINSPSSVSAEPYFSMPGGEFPAMPPPIPLNIDKDSTSVGELPSEPPDVQVGGAQDGISSRDTAVPPADRHSDMAPMIFGGTDGTYAVGLPAMPHRVPDAVSALPPAFLDGPKDGPLGAAFPTMLPSEIDGAQEGTLDRDFRTMPHAGIRSGMIDVPYGGPYPVMPPAQSHGYAMPIREFSARPAAPVVNDQGTPSVTTESQIFSRLKGILTSPQITNRATEEPGHTENTTAPVNRGHETLSPAGLTLDSLRSILGRVQGVVPNQPQPSMSSHYSLPVGSTNQGSSSMLSSNPGSASMLLTNQGSTVPLDMVNNNNKRHMLDGEENSLTKRLRIGDPNDPMTKLASILSNVTKKSAESLLPPTPQSPPPWETLSLVHKEVPLETPESPPPWDKCNDNPDSDRQFRGDPHWSRDVVIKEEQSKQLTVTIKGQPIPDQPHQVGSSDLYSLVRNVLHGVTSEFDHASPTNQEKHLQEVVINTLHTQNPGSSKIHYGASRMVQEVARPLTGENSLTNSQVSSPRTGSSPRPGNSPRPGSSPRGSSSSSTESNRSLSPPPSKTASLSSIIEDGTSFQGDLTKEDGVSVGKPSSHRRRRSSSKGKKHKHSKGHRSSRSCPPKHRFLAHAYTSGELAMKKQNVSPITLVATGCSPGFKEYLQQMKQTPYDQLPPKSTKAVDQGNEFVSPVPTLCRKDRSQDRKDLSADSCFSDMSTPVLVIDETRELRGSQSSENQPSNESKAASIRSGGNTVIPESNCRSTYNQGVGYDGSESHIKDPHLDDECTKDPGLWYQDPSKRARNVSGDSAVISCGEDIVNDGLEAENSNFPKSDMSISDDNSACADLEVNAVNKEPSNDKVIQDIREKDAPEGGTGPPSLKDIILSLVVQHSHNTTPSGNLPQTGQMPCQSANPPGAPEVSQFISDGGNGTSHLSTYSESLEPANTQMSRPQDKSGCPVQNLKLATGMPILPTMYQPQNTSAHKSTEAIGLTAECSSHSDQDYQYPVRPISSCYSNVIPSSVSSHGGQAVPVENSIGYPLDERREQETNNYNDETFPNLMNVQDLQESPFLLSEQMPPESSAGFLERSHPAGLPAATTHVPWERSIADGMGGVTKRSVVENLLASTDNPGIQQVSQGIRGSSSLAESTPGSVVKDVLYEGQCTQVDRPTDKSKSTGELMAHTPSHPYHICSLLGIDSNESYLDNPPVHLGPVSPSTGPLIGVCEVKNSPYSLLNSSLLPPDTNATYMDKFEPTPGKPCGTNPKLAIHRNSSGKSLKAEDLVSVLFGTAYKSPIGVAFKCSSSKVGTSEEDQSEAVLESDRLKSDTNEVSAQVDVTMIEESCNTAGQSPYSPSCPTEDENEFSVKSLAEPVPSRKELGSVSADSGSECHNIRGDSQDMPAASSVTETPQSCRVQSSQLDERTKKEEQTSKTDISTPEVWRMLYLPLNKDQIDPDKLCNLGHSREKCLPLKKALLTRTRDWNCINKADERRDVYSSNQSMPCHVNIGDMTAQNSIKDGQVCISTPEILRMLDEPLERQETAISAHPDKGDLSLKKVLFTKNKVDSNPPNINDSHVNNIDGVDISSAGRKVSIEMHVPVTSSLYIAETEGSETRGGDKMETRSTVHDANLETESDIFRKWRPTEKKVKEKKLKPKKIRHKSGQGARSTDQGLLKSLEELAAKLSGCSVKPSTQVQRSVTPHRHETTFKCPPHPRCGVSPRMLPFKKDYTAALASATSPIQQENVFGSYSLEDATVTKTQDEMRNVTTAEKAKTRGVKKAVCSKQVLRAAAFVVPRTMSQRERNEPTGQNAVKQESWKPTHGEENMDLPSVDCISKSSVQQQAQNHLRQQYYPHHSSLMLRRAPGSFWPFYSYTIHHQYSYLPYVVPMVNYHLRDHFSSQSSTLHQQMPPPGSRDDETDRGKESPSTPCKGPHMTRDDLTSKNSDIAADDPGIHLTGLNSSGAKQSLDAPECSEDECSQSKTMQLSSETHVSNAAADSAGSTLPQSSDGNASFEPKETSTPTVPERSKSCLTKVDTQVTRGIMPSEDAQMMSKTDFSTAFTSLALPDEEQMETSNSQMSFGIIMRNDVPTSSLISESLESDLHSQNQRMEVVSTGAHIEDHSGSLPDMLDRESGQGSSTLSSSLQTPQSGSVLIEGSNSGGKGSKARHKHRRTGKIKKSKKKKAKKKTHLVEDEILRGIQLLRSTSSAASSLDGSSLSKKEEKVSVDLPLSPIALEAISSEENEAGIKQETHGGTNYVVRDGVPLCSPPVLIDCDPDISRSKPVEEQDGTRNAYDSLSTAQSVAPMDAKRDGNIFPADVTEDIRSSENDSLGSKTEPEGFQQVSCSYTRAADTLSTMDECVKDSGSGIVGKDAAMHVELPDTIENTSSDSNKTIIYGYCIEDEEKDLGLSEKQANTEDFDGDSHAYSSADHITRNEESCIFAATGAKTGGQDAAIINTSPEIKMKKLVLNIAKCYGKQHSSSHEDDRRTMDFGRGNGSKDAPDTIVPRNAQPMPPHPEERMEVIDHSVNSVGGEEYSNGGEDNTPCLDEDLLEGSESSTMLMSIDREKVHSGSGVDQEQPERCDTPCLDEDPIETRESQTPDKETVVSSKDCVKKLSFLDKYLEDINDISLAEDDTASEKELRPNTPCLDENAAENPDTKGNYLLDEPSSADAKEKFSLPGYQDAVSLIQHDDFANLAKPSEAIEVHSSDIPFQALKEKMKLSDRKVHVKNSATGGEDECLSLGDDGSMDEFLDKEGCLDICESVSTKALGSSTLKMPRCVRKPKQNKKKSKGKKYSAKVATMQNDTIPRKIIMKQSSAKKNGVEKSVDCITYSKEKTPEQRRVVQLKSPEFVEKGSRTVLLKSQDLSGSGDSKKNKKKKVSSRNEPTGYGVRKNRPEEVKQRNTKFGQKLQEERTAIRKDYMGKLKTGKTRDEGLDFRKNEGAIGKAQRKPIQDRLGSPVKKSRRVVKIVSTEGRTGGSKKNSRVLRDEEGQARHQKRLVKTCSPGKKYAKLSFLPGSDFTGFQIPKISKAAHEKRISLDQDCSDLSVQPRTVKMKGTEVGGQSDCTSSSESQSTKEADDASTTEVLPDNVKHEKKCVQTKSPQNDLQDDKTAVNNKNPHDASQVITPARRAGSWEVIDEIGQSPPLAVPQLQPDKDVIGTTNGVDENNNVKDVAPSQECNTGATDEGVLSGEKVSLERDGGKLHQHDSGVQGADVLLNGDDDQTGVVDRSSVSLGSTEPVLNSSCSIGSTMKDGKVQGDGRGTLIEVPIQNNDHSEDVQASKKTISEFKVNVGEVQSAANADMTGGLTDGSGMQATISASNTVNSKVAGLNELPTDSLKQSTDHSRRIEASERIVEVRGRKVKSPTGKRTKCSPSKNKTTLLLKDNNSEDSRRGKEAMITKHSNKGMSRSRKRFHPYMPSKIKASSLVHFKKLYVPRLDELMWNHNWLIYRSEGQPAKDIFSSVNTTPGRFVSLRELKHQDSILKNTEEMEPKYTPEVIPSTRRDQVKTLDGNIVKLAAAAGSIHDLLELDNMVYPHQPGHGPVKPSHKHRSLARYHPYY